MNATLPVKTMPHRRAPGVPFPAMATGPCPQRSQGQAHVALASRGARTVLTDLAQHGSARAIFLPAPPGGMPEVVFLNTSGGLTGGDRLSLSLDLAADCRATGTTQTAERGYRAEAGSAVVCVHHRLGRGAHLDWLPQETILYDASAVERSTRIDLEPGASCLMLETVVLGRAAMGERVRGLRFGDSRTITRGGQPVLVEPLRLDGAALSAGAAVLGGARAFASLAMVGPGAEAAVAAVRAELDEAGVTAGASGFDGRLTVRMMAAEGWPLRRQIMRLLRRLRPGPLPRVWQMAGGPA